jgi:hypothetical protein
MELMCQYCNHTFSNRSNLISHQKKAKFCLKIQGKKTEKYVCKLCGKNLSGKTLIEKHQEKCGAPEKVRELTLKLEEKEKLIQLQQKQILELQKSLENIAIQGVKKSTTTTNNILLAPITDACYLNGSEQLRIEDVEGGAISLANHAYSKVFKGKVRCPDASRYILEYKEEDDSLIRDKKGRRLANKFFESIKSKNRTLIDQAIADIKAKMKADNSTVAQEVFFKQMNELVEISQGVDGFIKEKRDKLRDEFVKELCLLI